MNLLLFTHARPQFLPPVLVDEAECVAGPNYTHLRRSGRMRYLNTAGGAFEFSMLHHHLKQQVPELIAVHADATLGCLPIGLPSDSTKVLLIGGATHLLEKPLTNLLSYAVQEQFDHVILWNRHHAHFFCEYGFRSVHWMPGLTFAVPQVPIPTQKLNALCFFGQLGDYHPRRKRLVQSVMDAKLPLIGGNLPRLESLELAARSTLSLNVSLNGELNLRVFESAQHEALLLTDKLSRKSGLELFFPDGDALITYQNESELLERARYLLQHPDLVKTLATQARRVVLDHFSFERRRETFLRICAGDEVMPVFRLLDEPRCLLPSADENNRESLLLRIRIYEIMQELHRLEEDPVVMHFPGVHPLVVSDLADLCRLRQQLVIDNESFEAEWLAAMKELEVDNLSRIDPEEAAKHCCQTMLLGVADLNDLSVIARIQNKQQTRVILTDWLSQPDKRIERSFVELGYQTRHDILPGLFELNAT